MASAEYPTLVLFDIDGTLLKSNRAGRTAVNRALYELFQDDVPTDGVTFAGNTDWQILSDSLAPLGYTPAEIADVLPAFAAAIARHLAVVVDDHHVRALPGALELVAALADNPWARLGIVTGNAGPSAPVKLRAAGFDPQDFPVGAYGHEAMDRSLLPPLALQRAVEYWRVSFAPEQIVVVGDTPNDVICTRSVGGRALAVLTGWSDRAALEAEAPYAILDDLTDYALVEKVLFGEDKNG
jgi:phosphoglycolate phosphatase